MPNLPRDPVFDCTLRLLADPYRYILRRSRELGSDAFETRLMFERTICLTGAARARMFYDPALFVRQGALPRRVRRTLVGDGGVQTLDGPAHACRKAMLLRELTGAPAARLAEIAREEMEQGADGWMRSSQIVFYDEMKRVLARAACRFAGVPLSLREEDQRTRDLALLFEGAGRTGALHWRARLARERSERWIGAFVESVRREDGAAPEGAARSIALALDHERSLLPASVAAVEIVNVLRPVVAVAVYAAFVAHALHSNPEASRRIASGDEAYTRAFVHEVRRFYPFFPMVGARAARDFNFEGAQVRAGALFMLDLFGTCHDPARFPSPERFDPERFLGVEPDPFALAPQGGGDHSTGHRCAGEEITIALMSMIALFLTRSVRIELPPQDLGLAWSRPPALPKSGVIMRVHAS